MAKPVLVSSAVGGNQGKPGRHVGEMLLECGVPTREALIHSLRTLPSRG